MVMNMETIIFNKKAKGICMKLKCGKTKKIIDSNHLGDFAILCLIYKKLFYLL